MAQIRPAKADAFRVTPQVAMTTRQGWRESLLLVTLFSVIAAVMTAPAFHTYFFGENFNYLGQYLTHGSSVWRSLKSPSGGVSYRYQPVFFLFTLPWHFILPLTPLAFHLRNFGLIVINLWLLHRILLRLVSSKAARCAGLALFAFSKIHMTTIGYINLFDSIILLCLLLATVLFFLRYLEKQQESDYLLGVIFCSLSIFSKDYGLVIVPVIAALMLALDRTECSLGTLLKRCGWRLSPLVVIALSYLWIHFQIAGPPPTHDPSYTPGLRPMLSAARAVISLATIANLSIIPSAITGACGIGARFTIPAGAMIARLPTELSLIGTRACVSDIILCVLFAGLLVTTLIKTRLRWSLILALMIWICSYLGPTFLVNNVQLYYNHESLAGVALLIALCLDQAESWLNYLWLTAVTLIGINGWVSNWHSLEIYNWSYIAHQVEKAREPVIDTYKNKKVESVAFVTSGRDRLLWLVALGTRDFPLLPTVMQQPNLQISYIGYNNLPVQLQAADATHLVIDIDNGFLSYPRQLQPPLSLKSLSPSQVTSDQGFNLQPDGHSALITVAEHATPGTQVICDHHRLSSTVNGPTRVTALIPRGLLSRPGEYPIYLSDGVRKSNTLNFLVRSTAAREEAASLGAKPRAEWPRTEMTKSSSSYLIAEPNPVPYQKDTGLTNIRWQTGDNSWGEVYVSVDGGAKKLFADGLSGTASAGWIKAGSSYHFELEKDSDDETAPALSVDVKMSDKPGE